MPEVWVGTRRVSAQPAARPAEPATAPAAEPKIAAPPELKRVPFRPLDPPRTVEQLPVDSARPVTTVTHHSAGHPTLLMPAATTLPDYPAAPARVSEPTPTYSPMGSPEPPPVQPVIEKPLAPPVSETRTAEPEPRPPVIVPAPQVHVETTETRSTPLYVTAVAQMVGVLAALTIFCGLGLGAHLVLVRKYGASLLAPFRVEVIQTAPPIPPIPFTPPLKEMTALQHVADDEPPVEPNFEMPLTYEEEMALKKEQEQQQEVGVLQFIADMNRELQEQLKLLPKQ